ncbi:unnamed protein product [Paramecium sonneborni]|uniref:Uncharacterized protein n=1 Tax=Paramecium sonneborni TaxID=65129 RepID=A0A8S1P655_9CILI|nr:unnamed protein product [Paramecium sonneborni]
MNHTKEATLKQSIDQKRIMRLLQNRKHSHSYAPTFEILQATIRDFSYNRLLNVEYNQPKRSEFTHSQLQHQELQHIIKQILDNGTKSFSRRYKLREFPCSPFNQSQNQFIQSSKQFELHKQNSLFIKIHNHSNLKLSNYIQINKRKNIIILILMILIQMKSRRIRQLRLSKIKYKKTYFCQIKLFINFKIIF